MIGCFCKSNLPLFIVGARRSGGAVTPWGSRADTETAGRRRSVRIAWLVQSAPPGKHSPAAEASVLKLQDSPFTKLKIKKTVDKLNY